VRPLTTRLLSVRRSLPLFLAIIVCLAICQVWLTWRLMEQDRNLAAKRSRDRLEQIADLALAQLTGTLGAWDLGLRELAPSVRLYIDLEFGPIVESMIPHANRDSAHTGSRTCIVVTLG
jgi:hypothetical protein